MITKDGLVLSSPNKDYAGKTLDKLNDKLYGSFKPVLSNDDTKVTKVKGNDGTYYAIAKVVNGTDWKVINYAKESDVLSDLYKLVITVAVIAVILLIVIFILVQGFVARLIKKPVIALTNNIEHIAKGDFTVEIENEGNDEIAFMNSRMGDFIEEMKKTIKGINHALEPRLSAIPSLRRQRPLPFPRPRLTPLSPAGS